MKYYTKSCKYYCGIELHSKNMIGVAVSYLSPLISNAIVGAGSLGRSGSIWTEIGVNVALAASGNALTQGFFMSVGWQDEFSLGSLGMTAGSAIISTRLRIANKGYLRDSREAAVEYLTPEEQERFFQETEGWDATQVRLKHYREGGVLEPPDRLGVTRKGTLFGGVSNYERNEKTFVHEVGGHKFYNCPKHYPGDYDPKSNAYGFSSKIITNRYIGDPINSNSDKNYWVYWKNGIAYQQIVTFQPASTKYIKISPR